jgi:hypothetical protein
MGPTFGADIRSPGHGSLIEEIPQNFIGIDNVTPVPTNTNGGLANENIGILQMKSGTKPPLHIYRFSACQPRTILALGWTIYVDPNHADSNAGVTEADLPCVFQSQQLLQHLCGRYGAVL